MELVQELNYNLNRDIFLIMFNVKRTLAKKEDRCRVRHWLKKIMKSNKTLAELKLRNDFCHHLAKNVENGILSPPFDQDPSQKSLKMIFKSSPLMEDSPTNDEDNLLTRLVPAKYGGFLLPRPLPQIGAYCYISASKE